MSQLGSRVTALLNDEKDIDAVFTGVSGSSSLKTVLASLDSRQQAMVLSFERLFYLSGILFLCVLPLVFFLVPERPSSIGLTRYGADGKPLGS